MDSLIHNFKDGKNFVIYAQILPNSSKNSFVGLAEIEGKTYLKLKISKPAIDGKANSEICLFLSEILSLKKSDIEILRGEKSGFKSILIKNISHESLKQILNDYINRMVTII